MSGSTSIHISSGLHITRVESRFAFITEEVQSVDAIFVEGVYFDADSFYQLILNWLTFPFGLLAMKLYIIVLGTIGPLTGFTDQNLIDQLASHYDAEVVEVDENIHELISEGRYAWAVGHWATVFICSAGLSNWMGATAAHFQWMVNVVGSVVPTLLGWVVLSALALQIISWFLLGGAVLFLLFVAGTLTTRNQTIVSNMEEYVETNSVTNGCLIVGRDHEPAIERMVRRSELLHLGE